MLRFLLGMLLTSMLTGSASSAELIDSVRGQYLEARTCDVFTGPCFANADTGLTGRNAIMAWKVDEGIVRGTAIDGLTVIAVVAARETLGQKQHLPARSILLVDERATPVQREALIQLAKRQGGELLSQVIEVRSTPITIDICECKGNACAKLVAGKEVRIETRCIDLKHDRGCGNEYAFYPPLSQGVKAVAAMATESVFDGKGFNETWSDTERRGAYVGTFSVR